MVDKITSIAGLKKAVEEMREALAKNTGLHSGDYYEGWTRAMNKGLNLISEFEASVKERMVEIQERDERTLRVSGVPSGAHPIFEELREILGKEIKAGKEKVE